MKFILENNSKELNLEDELAIEEIKHNKYIDEYTMIDKADIENLQRLNKIEVVPIGTIPFVTKCINKLYGVTKENPIEIPSYLRTDEFLKRDYRFDKLQNLPKVGKFFIKNIEELKSFTYCGELLNVNIDGLMEEKKENDYSLSFKPDTLFSISEAVDILSEYRVYVINNKIVNISNYNGDCTLFPDINLIKKAMLLIEYNSRWLKSYTIDVMITNRGTSIIEIHNFTSVGLYSTLWGSDLLLGYVQGIEYLVYDNKILS